MLALAVVIFNFCFDIVSNSKQEKIVTILQDAHEKWFNIGTKLKLPFVQLKAIKQRHQADSKASFTDMLTERFQGNPDITTLIEVLKSPDINLPKMADNLQGKN